MKKRLEQYILAIIVCILFIAGSVFAGGTFSRIKIWVTGQTLTASDLNSEFDNIINNMDPDGIDDASTDSTAMNATADPYPGSVASKATDLRGEIQRIRYMLTQITGKTYWYEDPASDIASLSGSNFSVIPATDDTYSVGSSSYRYKDGHYTGSVYAGYVGGVTDPIDTGFFSEIYLPTISGVTGEELSNDTSMRDSSTTAFVTEHAVKTYVDASTFNSSGAVENRPYFYYSGTTCIRINAGSYRVWTGTKYLTVYWNTHLDFVFGPTGSNANSSALGASEWHMIYIDGSYVESAFPTGQITSATSAFYNSTSAVTRYNAYGGTYTTTAGDTQIFGVWSGPASGVSEFFQDGDYVSYDVEMVNVNGLDYFNVWTDSGVSIPPFARKAKVHAMATTNTANASYALWRTNGSSGTSGHHLCGYFVNGIPDSGSAVVITDSNQLIECMITNGTANLNTLYLWTDGWYFPSGM